MKTPPEFRKFLSTVSCCSYSDTDDCVLIDSQKSMVDFDAVKEAFSREISPKEKPASADGLFVDSDGSYVLVEFKSGSVNKYEVWLKAYDSAIILSDREDKSTSWIRKNVKFIWFFIQKKRLKIKMLIQGISC